MTENIDIDAVTIDLDNPDHIRADTMLHIADGLMRVTIPQILEGRPAGPERTGAVKALTGVAAGLRDNAAVLLGYPHGTTVADAMQFTTPPPNQKGE